MQLSDFAIEGFGSPGLGIERGDDDAESGLFPGWSGELLMVGVDLGFGGSNFVIDEGRFRGLGPD